MSHAPPARDAHALDSGNAGPRARGSPLFLLGTPGPRAAEPQDEEHKHRSDASRRRTDEEIATRPQ
jgi:hypothetical protein